MEFKKVYKSDFVMLIGLPGSGKSSELTRMFSDTPNLIWVSSDKIRKELYGDESIQDDPARVFDIMKKRTLEGLADGKTVVYDATNLSRKKRMGLLSQLPKDAKKTAIIIWARIETCIKRDAARARSVGEDVILKMVKQFQTPYFDEGWDAIYYKHNDDAPYSYEELSKKLDISHDNPHHAGTILEHITRVADSIKKGFCSEPQELGPLQTDILLKLAEVHDLGKAYTKSFVNSKGETTEIAHYYSHQNVSAYITLGYAFKDCWAGWDLSVEKRLLLSWYAGMHMEPFFQESKYYKQVDSERRKIIELFNKYDQLGA